MLHYTIVDLFNCMKRAVKKAEAIVSPTDKGDSMLGQACCNPECLCRVRGVSDVRIMINDAPIVLIVEQLNWQCSPNV